MRDDIWRDENLVQILKDGGIAVIPTDTIYGIVGSALSPRIVERIYKVRRRDPEKPCIILISSVNDIADFQINLSEKHKSILNEYWPGPVSIVLDCKIPELRYIHRGTNTLAFRVPAYSALRDLLKQTGPLIAPSANTAGNEVSHNIDDAKKYFGKSVDVYLDAGEIHRSPSLVIRLHEDCVIDVLRG